MQPFMQLLAGDIGGTGTRLRLVEFSPSLGLRTLYEDNYRSGDFDDLVPIVIRFLEAGQTATGTMFDPEMACFAIAGPVVNNQVQLTNLTWFLDGERLSRELDIPQVSLINDFAAVGYGILGLQSQDLITLQDIPPQPGAPIGVIGAGTGLGEAFLIQQGENYQVFATEGGHGDFAPRNELEFKLLQYILNKHGIARSSIERVVSGLGIISIYQFLRDTSGEAENPEIAQVVRNWEKGQGGSDPGATIGTAALNNSDRLSVETMRIFVSCYGAEAHNFALKLLPYGGLYIAGGIAPRNLPLMQNGNFMKNFVEGGTMTSLLQNIPVHIIVNEQVGLIGAALFASRL